MPFAQIMSDKLENALMEGITKSIDITKDGVQVAKDCVQVAKDCVQVAKDCVQVAKMACRLPRWRADCQGWSAGCQRSCPRWRAGCQGSCPRWRAGCQGSCNGCRFKNRTFCLFYSWDCSSVDSAYHLLHCHLLLHHTSSQESLAPGCCQ